MDLRKQVREPLQENGFENSRGRAISENASAYVMRTASEGLHAADPAASPERPGPELRAAVDARARTRTIGIGATQQGVELVHT